MSFILDALKKSETDRQQQSAPDISDVPTGTSKASTPRWLWILIALLAVNLVVLTVVLVKPVAVTAPTVVSSPPDRVVESPPASNLTAAIPTPVRKEEPLPAAQESTQVIKPAPVAEAVTMQPIIRRTAPAATETQLTFNDLRASGNLSLPDLNIDIHVFSEKPADRFVFINMNQYRENSTLTEGPLLREITTEGAILEYAGATFLLPRD